jgi:hypothetical protein
MTVRAPDPVDAAIDLGMRFANAIALADALSHPAVQACLTRAREERRRRLLAMENMDTAFEVSELEAHLLSLTGGSPAGGDVQQLMGMPVVTIAGASNPPPSDIGRKIRPMAPSPVSLDRGKSAT